MAEIFSFGQLLLWPYLGAIQECDPPTWSLEESSAVVRLPAAWQRHSCWAFASQAWPEPHAAAFPRAIRPAPQRDKLSVAAAGGPRVSQHPLRCLAVRAPPRIRSRNSRAIHRCRPAHRENSARIARRQLDLLRPLGRTRSAAMACDNLQSRLLEELPRELDYSFAPQPGRRDQESEGS